MNIHEHQAKEVLKKYGVNVPVGFESYTIDDTVANAKKLFDSGNSVVVLKAQIHAGGRGKAGGVKLCRNLNDVKNEAQKMLGMTLITNQTGPEGKEVKRLYVEAGSKIKKEYYLSFIVDRKTSGVTIVGSSEGGMDIEEVAHNSPEKIISVETNPAGGYFPAYARHLGFKMGLSSEQVKKLAPLVENLYKCFVETDASQIEINPLVELEDGNFICLDAKFNFDNNALFRQPQIVAMRDLNEEEALEIEASKYGLSYIKMDGSIGCMVNGAGLAMATMDIIKLYGKEPANFLDVGGGANKEKVCAAFKIILSDPGVKGILVNIFGGIMRCDIIAEGILAAVKEAEIKVPLVVRLEGTNVDLGKKILKESGLNIIPADNLEDAAKKITAAVH